MIQTMRGYFRSNGKQHSGARKTLLERIDCNEYGAGVLIKFLAMTMRCQWLYETLKDKGFERCSSETAAWCFRTQAVATAYLIIF